MTLAAARSTSTVRKRPTSLRRMPWWRTVIQAEQAMLRRVDEVRSVGGCRPLARGSCQLLYGAITQQPGIIDDEIIFRRTILRLHLLSEGDLRSPARESHFSTPALLALNDPTGSGLSTPRSEREDVSSPFLPFHSAVYQTGWTYKIMAPHRDLRAHTGRMEERAKRERHVIAQRTVHHALRAV